MAGHMKFSKYLTIEFEILIQLYETITTAVECNKKFRNPQQQSVNHAYRKAQPESIRAEPVI